MTDCWPSVDNLSLAEDHLIWKLPRNDDDHIKFMVESPKYAGREVLINVQYAPVLACFDFEYWNTMDLQESLMDPREALRVQCKKKYFQNLRQVLVHSVFSAETKTLMDGSWAMSPLHEWSIRTWNKHSHSPFGRSQYLEKCKNDGKTPYAQLLTTYHWINYFRQSSRCKKIFNGIATSVRVEPSERRPEMSAYDLLTSLHMVPPAPLLEGHVGDPIHPDGSASSNRAHQNSVFYKLPNELMDMIMSLVVDADWSCKDVLQLRSVSELWKCIAERCSQLWHKLSIDLPGFNGRWGSRSNFIRSFDLVKKYLLHSNNVVLDITMYVRSSRWSDDGGAEKVQEIVQRTLLELLKHSRRWIAFELLLDTDRIADSETQRLLDLFRQTRALDEAKHLETLAICHSEAPHFRFHHHIRNTSTESTPRVASGFRLRHLRCDASIQSFSAAMFLQITVLSIAHWQPNMPPNLMLAVLEHTPALVDLTLRSLICRDVVSPPRHLPNLKAIRFIDTSRPDSAMCSFSAPALETIQVLSASDGGAVLSYQSFVQLMGSSEALTLIKHLDISGARVANQDLQRVLEACQSATRLAFRATHRDQVRTGILKYIRESIRGRLRAPGVQKIDVTVAGWIDGRKANPSVMEEWNKLKALSTSFSVPGEFVFTRRFGC